MEYFEPMNFSQVMWVSVSNSMNLFIEYLILTINEYILFGVQNSPATQQ